jgi:hypothetical protein
MLMWKIVYKWKFPTDAPNISLLSLSCLRACRNYCILFSQTHAQRIENTITLIYKTMQKLCDVFYINKVNKIAKIN